MAFYGIFIGVGKYADPDVPELVGASRDATALHALFADSLGDPAPLLLVDENATVENVRRGFSQIDATAEAGDTVVLYFSGHGSHDHRLAAHDTKLSDLPATTVPMDEVAMLFRRAKARAVLCILDCCFSGGAPAKVLEASPIPRDVLNPFTGLVGEGRLLLTACALDEVAYESPTTRHGVLTKTLLDLFCGADGPINLLSAMDQILQGVRAESSRMGITQTPVLLGTVQGGLILPKLTAGDLFRRSFPEYSRAVVSAEIADLAKLGFQDLVVHAWAAKYPRGLNELQLTAINDYRVADGSSLVVVAPTSSGKTFVGEIAAARAIAEGRKSVFLFPYKALVNEKFDQFSDLYGGQLGMRVIRCTGDYTDDTGAFIRGKYDLAVLTYEMFLQLVVSFPTIRQQLALVVLDEAQFISDPGRGINVELLLTYLLAGREVGVSPQLVALSAVIGNANSFHEWLGCGLLMTSKRPVPLIEGVIDRSGTYDFLDTDGTTKTEQMVSPYEIVVRRDKPSAQDLIVPLVRKLVRAGEKVIIFRNQRGSAQGCANYLAQDLDLPSAAETVAALPSSDGSGSSSALRTCLMGGTAFHTTNLTREERVIVEQAFRNANSFVRALAATTTVAAGINTPASTVILAEQEFVGEEGRPFTVAEYKNMAGRAGRLGFQEKGKSIIYAESASERRRLFQRYVLGQLESLHSSFEAEHLHTWILRLLAQAKAVPRAEVSRLLANTYAGYLQARQDPGWRSRMEVEIDRILGRMITLQLLEVEGDRVRLTLLGRACGRSALSFDSAFRLVDLIRSIPHALFTAQSVLALVQVLDETSGGYTPMLQGQRESARVAQANQRFGHQVVSSLQRYANDTAEYWARCKRAAILFDWIDGRRVEQIETEFSTTPFRGKIEHGDIRRFADSARFVMRSAGEIFALLLPDTNLIEQLDTVLNRLETGLPEQALGLLHLPVSLTRGQYLDLYNAGLSTAAIVWAADEQRLAALLPAEALDSLEKKRPRVVST